MGVKSCFQLERKVSFYKHFICLASPKLFVCTRVENPQLPKYDIVT